MKFDSNPLSGVSISGTNKKKNNQIVDSSGNVLLQREGIGWDEGDQIPYDLLMKSMDYDYQMDLLNFQNEYNSPAEQARRMREAGINPDLVGTANNPSASSSATAPSTQLNEGDKKMRQMQMAKSFIDLIPQAMSIYSQMKSLNQESTLRDINILKGVQSLGDAEIGRQLTLDDLKDFTSYPQPYLSHIKNKKLRSKVDDYVYSILATSHGRDYAKGLVYDARQTAEKNRQGFLGLLGQYGYSVDDDLFVGVLREFNDVLFGSQKSKNKYNKDYYDEADGTLQGELDNSSNEKAKLESENDISAELFAKAGKLFESDDKKEQAKGAIMYILLSLLQNVSFSHSSGPKGSSSSFGL